MLLGKMLVSDDKSLWSHPLVHGVRVGLQWRDVEFAPGVFDWSGLDEALKAVPQSKQVYLDVVGGALAPAWLRPRMIVPDMANGKRVLNDVPVVWSKPYVQAQKRLWAGLGKHLEDRESQITAVNVALVASMGSKLRFAPDADLEDLRFLEYRPAAMLDAWQEISKAVSYALPTADMVLPVMNTELESFPALGEKGEGPLALPVPLVHQIVGYGATYYPGRLIVAWSGKVEDQEPEAMRRYELQGANMGFAPQKGVDGPEQCQVVFVSAKALLG